MRKVFTWEVFWCKLLEFELDEEGVYMRGYFGIDGYILSGEGGV